jgi:hypothetical protein
MENSEICKDFENFDFSEFLPKNIKAVVIFQIPEFDLEFPEIIVKEPIKKVGTVQKDRTKLKNQNDIF